MFDEEKLFQALKEYYKTNTKTLYCVKNTKGFYSLYGDLYTEDETNRLKEAVQMFSHLTDTIDSIGKDDTFIRADLEGSVEYVDKISYIVRRNGLHSWYGKTYTKFDCPIYVMFNPDIIKIVVTKDTTIVDLGVENPTITTSEIDGGVLEYLVDRSPSLDIQKKSMITKGGSILIPVCSEDTHTHLEKLSRFRRYDTEYLNDRLLVIFNNIYQAWRPSVIVCICDSVSELTGLVISRYAEKVFLPNEQYKFQYIRDFLLTRGFKSHDKYELHRVVT